MGNVLGGRRRLHVRSKSRAGRGRLRILAIGKSGFAGIDADDCRNPETGELDSATAELVRLIGSYAEVSPSLKGIKIYVKAGLSGEGNNFEFQGREYQIYDTGAPLP